MVPDAAISLFGGRLNALSSLLVRQLGGAILGLAILDVALARSDIQTLDQEIEVRSFLASQHHNLWGLTGF